MASSFFHRGGPDSSSESDEDDISLHADSADEEIEEDSEEQDEDDDDDSDSDSEEAEEKRKGVSRFYKDNVSSSDESEEDERAKVKSAKDKRLEEIRATIKAIENAQKIDDWALIATEYDKLNRQALKLVIDGKAPKEYIKSVAELENLANYTINKQKVTPKKMTATTAKGLNTVRQRIKKQNKEFQEQIDSYREDPLGYTLDESDDEAAPTTTERAALEPGEIEQEGGDDEGFTTVPKGRRTVHYTPESIFKHLRIIMESRGKKNTDRSEQIKVMEKLLEIAATPYQQIRVLLTLISSRFDLGAGSATSLPLEHWKPAESEISTLLKVLDSNTNYVVIENSEEWDDDEKVPVLAPGEKFIKVPGSIVSFVERLDDELVRSLQNIDPHTPEYVERLQDEGPLCNIIFRGLLYYEWLQRQGLELPADVANRIVMRRLEHIYYKPAQVIKIFEENCWKLIPPNVDSEITARAQSLDPHSLVNILCAYLFAKSEGILRARAMLCQIYFFALHDDYYKARDMLLMSHLQETIPNFDVQTQILFNRTLVQIGLCAFRKGLVYDAQNTLQEICGSGRQKELLAQGVMLQRYNQISADQEKLEKQRQLPFHVHINLELLECVYLTCSMLLEIPLLAQTGSSPDLRKRVISKTYRRMLEYHERQIFTGPPENTRDHVMQASKALAAGEWKRAIQYIHSIKIWELMPNCEEIQAMLSKQIQEEGLRTYLFTYAPFYDTLSLSTLSDMFELESAKVAAVVSKMISHEEISASLDQVTSTVIFRKGVELSRLQSLALTLSDKASALIETNERTLEQRTQGSANAFDRQSGRGARGGLRGGQRPGRGGPRVGGNMQRQVGGTQFTGGALGAAVRG